MKITHRLAQLQQEHVVMELEGIDRMYLNAYVPQLTSERGIAAFCRGYLGHRFASTKQAVAMTEAFVKSIQAFVREEGLELVRFQKGQRKDDIMKARLRRFKKPEGVVFVGVAQEKVRVPRTTRIRVASGGTIPWIIYSTALVNVYYFYCQDRDFGPFFLKFCSYFPYGAKLCLNGHEYLKCQLAQRGIAFAALDNGLLSCADVPAAQRICDGLSAPKIEAFFRKWLARLPHPYSAKDRRAGYRYDLSILQAEFSLTQIWDRAVYGRCFFEEVIRENIDLGRPEQVQLIFGRKMQRKTATDDRCRTRIITEGVVPSLHVYYKNTHLKQYHKQQPQGGGLRTETTINNTYDFGVGRRLKNLAALRQIGFAANRRVLEVEQLTHDCHIGAQAFDQLQKPAEVDGQHASALPFGHERVQALLTVLVLFCLQPEGFRNRQLRPLLAQLLGLPQSQISPGRMSYDLRRLRLHGLIERIPKTQRYRLTTFGLKTALFYSRVYQRLLRRGLSELHDARISDSSTLAAIFAKFQKTLDAYVAEKMAA
jgi:DNA-binding HxlR family transcriptional regulator